MQRGSSKPTLLDFARLYAHRGLRVLPLHSFKPEGGCTCGNPRCPSPGKHPRTKDAALSATTNPAQLADWWERFPQANVGIATGEGLLVIVIDTLARARSSRGSSGSVYAEDYAAITPLKQLAEQYHVSILVIHHLRKSASISDPMDEISGSTGLTGATDCNMMLQRERRAMTAQLFVTGRDVEEQQLTLSLNNLLASSPSDSAFSKERKERKEMFRPKTIEKLAIYAEKAGRLAAAVMRAQPDVAEELAPDLFNLVAEAFCQAADHPGTSASLRDSRSYAEFMLAWEDVMNSMESDQSR